MPDFPAFVRNPPNRIARSSQFTDDIEGFVWDGADGSQVCLWTCKADRVSKEHPHDLDEYVLVIEGKCTVAAMPRLDRELRRRARAEAARKAVAA